MNMNKSTDIHVEFPCINGAALSGRVYAIPLGPHRYRLEETPFAGFVEVAAFGDLIEAAPNAMGALVFQRIVQKSNYKHFDYLLSKDVVESAELKALMERVENEGGQWEIVFGGMVFISLPLESDFDVAGAIQSLSDAFIV